jgi:hypothetical protein
MDAAVIGLSLATGLNSGVLWVVCGATWPSSASCTSRASYTAN